MSGELFEMLDRASGAPESIDSRVKTLLADLGLPALEPTRLGALNPVVLGCALLRHYHNLQGSEHDELGSVINRLADSVRKEREQATNINNTVNERVY